METIVDLNDTYWDRLVGYVTDLRVDARWVLRGAKDNKSYGSLRIVSHPDLPPGQLRAIFTYVMTIKPKTKEQKIKAIEDYQMEITELEVYSVGDDIKTETKTYEAQFKELEEMFGIKIFK
jgi:hypothetical protein